MSQLFPGCINNIIRYVDVYTYHELAKNGNIELIKFIHSISPNLVINRTIMIAAMGGTHLDLMDFLRANGYQWNGDEWFTAITNNNMSAMGYLLQNNCPMSPMCCMYYTEMVLNRQI